jgi:hypothetical protein
MSPTAGLDVFEKINLLLPGFELRIAKPVA